MRMGAVQENRPAFQLRHSMRPPRQADVPTPGNLVSSLPGVPTYLEDRQGAAIRLRVLLRRLDRWLDMPLRIYRDKRGHTAWLMGAVGYRVDAGAKRVYPRFRDASGVHMGTFTVDVVNFLCKPRWLAFVARNQGLSDTG